jgi:hypothetical protein
MLGTRVDERKTRQLPIGGTTLVSQPAVAQPENDTFSEIQSITDNRGIDVALVDTADAPGVRDDFRSAPRALRPGRTLQSVGVFRGHPKSYPDFSGAASGGAGHATGGTGPKEWTLATPYAPAARNGLNWLNRIAMAC